MLSYEDIERLEQNRSEEGVVSLYLKIDPRLMYTPDQALKKFKGEAKRFLRNGPSARDREAIERENELINRYLFNLPPAGRGLVIFACQPLGLFETINLDVLTPTNLSVDLSPRTSILLGVLDENPRFIVATVHRDQASIYITERRQAGKTAEIATEVQGWHSQGGWSQSRFQRHIRDQARDHLKKVVEDLERLKQRLHFDRLVLGGAEQSVTELVRLLPATIRDCVIGIFPVDHKHETEEDILNKARLLNEAFERKSEKELVERICNAARAVLKQGVLGLEPTLMSLLEGRVQTLVIADGTQCDGSICQVCGYISANHLENCRLCGGHAEKTTDIIDSATEKALLSGAQVDTVFGEARDRLIAEGGIGALLRYPVESASFNRAE